jgi:predicted signal transduction protein with EAL and GGDEF domain
VEVALFPEDGESAEILLKHAEAAIKKAKAGGDRYLFYAKSMTASVVWKLILESQLRQALENVEFVVHCQPKFELETGRLRGAEALLRWNDPRTGLVAPGQFIPLLEESGLIYGVGQWALRQAIADYMRWRDMGLSAVPIAGTFAEAQSGRRRRRNRGAIAHAPFTEMRRGSGVSLWQAGIEGQL